MTGPISAAVDELTDLSELLGAIAVAGLARPDPELVGELREFGERAARLGWDEGARRIEAFARTLEALGREGSREEVRHAIDALQRLVAWTRLMRVEMELVRAEQSTRRGAD